MRSLALVFSFLFAGVVQAVPVTWTLDATFTGESFIEEPVATGQFTFDADLGQFTDVNIWFGVTGYEGWSYFDSFFAGDGTAMPTLITQGYDYSEGYPVGEYTNLSFAFEQALTNTGGIVDLASGHWFLNVQNPGSEECYFLPYCLDSEEYLISGTVSAVPIPAAAWLFASALAGLGWIKRKQAT